jgi:prepilin-type processing-associated H-X9-DG protein
MRTCVPNVGAPRSSKMLVVLAIISMLLGLLLPAVQNARLASKRIVCANNLKQIGIAFHNHADSNKAMFTQPASAERIGWRVRLLPFLEESSLINEYRRDRPWSGIENEPLLSKMPKIFSCPLSNGKEIGHASYETAEVVVSFNPLTPPDYQRMVMDPTRQRHNRPITIEVSDEYARPWLDPNPHQLLPSLLNPANGEADRLKRAFGGNHVNVFPILFADGHVGWFSTSVDSRPLFEMFAGARDVSELEQ